MPEPIYSDWVSRFTRWWLARSLRRVTSTDVMASLSRTQRPSLAQVVSDSLTELDRIVAKTLAKNPEDRYQSAKDLTVDLAWQIAAPGLGAGLISRQRRRQSDGRG